MRYVLLHLSSFVLLFARFLIESWSLRLCILCHGFWVFISLVNVKWNDYDLGHWNRVRVASESGLLVAFSLSRVWAPLALFTIPSFYFWHDRMYEASLLLCVDWSPLQWLSLGGAAGAAQVKRGCVENQKDMHVEALKRIFSRKAQILLLSTAFFQWHRRLLWYVTLALLDGYICWASPSYMFHDWSNVPESAPTPLYNYMKVCSA